MIFSVLLFTDVAGYEYQRKIRENERLHKKLYQVNIDCNRVV